ncbi:putative GTPase-activating protein [Rhodotorula toruloides]|nr:putative GTPase-activating protein [Rhodotorula toruloides]
MNGLAFAALRPPSARPNSHTRLGWLALHCEPSVLLPVSPPRWEAAQQREQAHRAKQRCVGFSCPRHSPARHRSSNLRRTSSMRTERRCNEAQKRQRTSRAGLTFPIRACLRPAFFERLSYEACLAFPGQCLQLFRTLIGEPVHSPPPPDAHFDTMSSQKLLPAFTPQQHRRRVSLLSTPPETPIGAFFGSDSRKLPAATSSTIVFPDTPPATPTRAQPGTAAEEKGKEKPEDEGLPRPASHRRAPSQAYASHRRTSTATMIRLALASKTLSPPRLVLLLILIIFTASFLPSPLTLFHRSPRAKAYDVHSRPAAAMPTYAQNNRPAAAIGETAQRKAWENTFPYRIPPQQHIVAGAEAVEGAKATSQDGELFRQHPELLAAGVRPVRRVPLRMEKARPAVIVEGAAEDVEDIDTSFDDASRSPPRRGAGWGKNTQLSRMKKVAVAKGQNARVGRVAPLDSSNALAEQDRVIVEDGTTRKKLRNPSGAVVELEKEMQAERKAPKIRRSMHHERALAAKPGGGGAGGVPRGVFNWKSELRGIGRRLEGLSHLCEATPGEPRSGTGALRDVSAHTSAQVDLFREAFGLPDEEQPLGEVHAVLAMAGHEDAYSGKLYLSTSYLTFTSLDRRSCRLTLPLATVRRVEKLAPGQEGTAVGAFALGLTLFHGLRIIVQLNSLRPTNDAFCANLRVRLKASLPLMKALKPFANTFFSEWFLSPDREDEERRKKDEESKVAELISFDEKGKGKEDDEPWTTESGIDGRFHAGLGMIFKYPGDPRKLREKSKMKLWRQYLQDYGRNLTLIRYPSFTRLVLVGLPNRLRGEMWELTCGSMFMRLQNPGMYEQILKDNEGRRSASTDDIEKDLHRSLPEYPAYQDVKGIDTMRRVLTAYAWSNPALGYCQAMNLVTASFLIYMSEEQCFWCLSVLCDRLLPGYYSPSMYGTVLDQRVFEHLVQRCLPSLHDHFVQADIQLSVASLPWFLSLYISSMPMVFAFRIIDCFFLMGPKVLFQVGLAILKLNGAALLETTDDGAFINVLKSFFATLGESAHPDSHDPRQRQVTKFQGLFVVAFREFSIITDDTIASERKRFRSEVLVSIETFAKRTAIRNLQTTGRLNQAQLGLAYDHFQLAVLQMKERERQDKAANGSRSRSSSTVGRSPAQSPRPDGGASSLSSGSKPPKEETKPEDRLDRTAFGRFMADVATWARNEKLVKNGLLSHIEREPADHALIDKVFLAWDVTHAGSLSFQDVISGLDTVLFNDLMLNVSWLFSLYDADKDGYLTKDEVLQVSEALLFIFRNEPGDRYLGSISNMLQNLFEYGESTKPPAKPQDGTQPADSPEIQSTEWADNDPNRPFLSHATFRMCILADALLEDFFDSDLTNSWRLEVLVPEEKPKPQTLAGGWWGGLVSAIVTDENKERFNRLADEVGKRLDIQTVEQRPSIGKLDAAAAAIEPTARDSLFSTSSNRKKAPLPPASDQSAVNPLSAAAMRMPAYPTQENPWADAASEKGELSSSAPKHDIDVQALAQQAMQRPQFAVDEATEGGEGEDMYGGEGEEGLLGQVDAMLQADDASRHDDDLL